MAAIANVRRYLHPITYGEYPSNMRSIVKTRLPSFSLFQKLKLAGYFDFLGVNYYTAYWALNQKSDPKKVIYTTHSQVDLEGSKNSSNVRKEIIVYLRTHKKIAEQQRKKVEA
ncbi:hypothetical protein RJ639_019004 [Escallonia herrerae]|uniref:Beta-glucosidase n=1 Tax=Escallonia herrerae TaxID=1293975 RepID=A0AA88V6K5_9ASTE|nr:hypothetical protein RJ639_019004 [Escallonia herrerae]